MKRNFLALSLGIGVTVLLLNFPTLNGAKRGQPANVSSSNLEISDVPNVKLEAKSAYVFGVSENKPIFSLNENLQLPLASLTKIMTALVAEEDIPSYALISVSKNAIAQEGNNGLMIDERWPLLDLIDVMLISSSNDAAYALAEEGGRVSEFVKKEVAPPSSEVRPPDLTSRFVSLMNQKAAELGLTQTYFFNPTGLDISESQSGAYGSVKDMADLFLYILKEKASLFEITRYSTLKIDSREFKNTNIISNEIPRVIFSKTGFSDLAGGNLAMVVDRGFENYVIIVVMGSTEQGRFEDVKKLYQTL